jgi:glycosyltransferase involved in cell wall biosynthesis
MMKVLVITNLFGYPWDPTRGMFNQQQFDRLAQRVELSVLVAVPWLDALKRPRAYWSARRDGQKRWPYVDYFIFWYVPGVAQALHSVFFLVSLALQRPITLFVKRWQALIGSWGFPDAVATSVVGRLTSTPVLMKVHGTDVNDYLDVPSKRWQIMSAVRHSRAVMCASAALSDRLVKAGAQRQRVHAIYNGVDSSRFFPARNLQVRATLGIPSDAQMLLFIGNLKPAKGCVDLLDAFIATAGSQPELHLVVIGDGAARVTMTQRAAQAGLAARLHLVGKVEHELLPDWFAATDLFCLPSHNEGVPNVVLEAMACGVPVLATRVGGIPEVVPEFAGVLVPAQDGPALAAALSAALARPWDAALIAAHARSFSWDTNIERVMTLLQTTSTPSAAVLTP